jgi:hypothetical protein
VKRISAVHCGFYSLYPPFIIFIIIPLLGAITRIQKYHLMSVNGMPIGTMLFFL